MLKIPAVDMSVNRACTVRVMAVCHDRKMFFIKKRGKVDPEFIQLPGGGSDRKDNGDIRLTARRELSEETGIWVEDLDRFSLVFERTKEARSWFCTLVFLEQDEVERHIPESVEGKVARLYPNDVLGGGTVPLSNNQFDILRAYAAGEYKQAA